MSILCEPEPTSMILSFKMSPVLLGNRQASVRLVSFSLDEASEAFRAVLPDYLDALFQLAYIHEERGQPSDQPGALTKTGR
jgi:hypothetical protein